MVFPYQSASQMTVALRTLLKEFVVLVLLAITHHSRPQSDSFEVTGIGPFGPQFLHPQNGDNNKSTVMWWVQIN